MARSRISKVTTKTGDRGQSRLATGKALPKTHAVFRALGSVDELNSSIGVLLAHGVPDGPGEFLAGLQQSLFDLGAFFAMEGEFAPPDVAVVEAEASRLNASLPPLEEFVLPGGNPACAQAHLCRAVCRRAELDSWVCVEAEERLMPGAQYLNRVGDYLFVLARTLADDESQWRGPR